MKTVGLLKREHQHVTIEFFFRLLKLFLFFLNNVNLIEKRIERVFEKENS